MPEFLRQQFIHLAHALLNMEYRQLQHNWSHNKDCNAIYRLLMTLSHSISFQYFMAIKDIIKLKENEPDPYKDLERI